MAKEKAIIKPGQTVWVSKTDKRGLVEHEVVRVNSSSIYVTGKEIGYEKRFNKRTMTCGMFFGYSERIWLDSNEYWRVVELREERKAITEELENLLAMASVVQLREVKQLLGDLK